MAVPSAWSRRCPRAAVTAVAWILLALVSTRADASDPAPYSMVYYALSPDPVATRSYLQPLRDLGCTRVHTLVYWWQAETLGGDYWKKDYRPEQIGQGYYAALDHFVNISRQLGMAPSLRLGSNREYPGLWHPADPSGRIEPYAQWVETLARRYAGRIDHYVIGDEENKDLTPGEYLNDFLIPLSAAIRRGDPSARVSPCATSSSPAVAWTLDLISAGLPKHADGIACNFWYTQIDDRWEIEDLMTRVRKVWPAAEFYSSGMVYAEHRGLDDRRQAAVVAQCMFNLWDLGWNSAPYYLYNFSITADTKENYGLAQLPAVDAPLVPSAGWKAYQTIARTFTHQRDFETASADLIATRPADEAPVAGGGALRLAPSNLLVRSMIRKSDGALLVYLAVPNVRRLTHGAVDITVRSDRWTRAQQIPLLDHAGRIELNAQAVPGQRLLVRSVPVGTEPTILVFTKP